MVYEIFKNGILINDKKSFNPQHIFECGQVFCYKKIGNTFLSFPKNKFAKIVENKNDYFIETKDISFFVNYFDLKTNYEDIKKQLLHFPIMIEPLKYGYGIRILKQDLFETLISFIISANNNIKRIQLILNNIRKNLGNKIFDDIYSFPNYEILSEQDENFFVKMGAGYRAKYIVNVLKQISPQRLTEFKSLDTLSLRNELIKLSGVGPKVADCILLFGYNRQDVFPVDTWINKCYNQFYYPTFNREKIRENLVKQFGFLSGYAQQYLFYYQRSLLNKN